jgi:hypothetical protein
MKHLALTTMMFATLALASPTTPLAAFAQQTATADRDADKAKSEADKAGDDAKDAAKKAGSATKHAAKATAHGAKSTAKTVKKDTKRTSKAVEHDTKGAVKTTGDDVQSVGSAIKGEVTGDHSNATAKCSDGTFWYSAERAGACAEHGGVSTWMK